MSIFKTFSFSKPMKGLFDAATPEQPTTMAGWKQLVESLPRNERDQLWPGMHKDIIPAYEMLQAQGQANAVAGVTWDSAKSALTPSSGPKNSVDPTTTPLDSVQETQYIGIKEDPDGADVTDLAQEILDTYDDIEAVWAMYTDVEPVITSGREGKHTAGSKHYEGKAIDVRANNISDEMSQKIADSLQARLGYKYDVDFEHFPEDPRWDHVHIEFDPK